jgi:hypothetical protein
MLIMRNFLLLERANLFATYRQEMQLIQVARIGQAGRGASVMNVTTTTPWSESTSELYRPSDLRLSVK